MAGTDKEVVQVMSDYVNSSASDYSEFARLMSFEHRTLQQNFTRLCVEWLRKLAETENFDERNEASIRFAKSIEDKLTALPYI